MSDEPAGKFLNRLQATRHDSLMTLSRGVAHDFNNLLAAVQGNAIVAKRFLPDDFPARESFNQIGICTTRALELSRKLAIYAGCCPAMPVPLDMGAVVERAIDSLKSEGLKLPTVRLQLDEGLPMVHADEKLLLNLVRCLLTNATEALLERDGNITIAASLFDYAGNTIHAVYPPAPKPGQYVRLTVTDTGRGIARRVQTHMFEPFFTTKIRGQGLGLCIVLGTVRTHGGIILVDSRLHKGSTFTVMLPC